MPKLQLPTQRVRAPEFPQEFGWVNTDRPFSIHEQLKGTVVVLDFWTYCCINCMHILPDLEYIETKYAGQPVLVIGVHSAKFDNEGDRENIRSACARYNIAHPVIVDERHRIWSEYGVRAWPTLVVIDAAGRIVGSLSGEGNRDVLDAAIETLLAEGAERGILAAAAPSYQRTGRVPSASGLAFPGKVLAAPAGEYIFISDSNHDRIIVADTSGKVLAIAGSGRKGLADGTFAEAEFDNPQGLAYDSAQKILYAADTDNHLIRKLDLAAQTVTMISGTGAQTHDRVGGGAGRVQGLNSPWDLELANGTLYIAMAGPHQLWELDLQTRIARAWAGSGREDLYDAVGLDAALAQPSGLVRKGDWLYFADSEVSAIRRVNLQTRAVQTLIGSGLFDFGDRDGALSRAALQHPLGVAVAGEDVLVADTYNHKIKRIREAAGEIAAIAGSGQPHAASGADGDLSLYEPGGISVRGDLLYIADTNHDRIIEYHLKTGAWREFVLRGLRTLESQQLDAADAPEQELAIADDQPLTLLLTPRFPPGIHLNKDAPINYAVNSLSDGGSFAVEGLAVSGTVPVKVMLPAGALQRGGKYRVLLSLAYCTDSQASICVPVNVMWRLHIAAQPSAVREASLQVDVQPL